MRPFTVLIGIVLGSAASITFGLGAVLIVFWRPGGRTPRIVARNAAAAVELACLRGFDRRQRREFPGAGKAAAVARLGASGHGRLPVRRGFAVLAAPQLNERVRESCEFGRLWAVLACAGLLLAGCAGPLKVPPPSTDIDETAYGDHVRVLASDEFQGRKPGTPGEDKTVAYLIEQFRKLGLKPGNGASYVQQVPMVEIAAGAEPTLTVGGRRRHPQPGLRQGHGDLDQARRAASASCGAANWCSSATASSRPEYAWNDYASIDVHGKTVMVLANDPGYASKDPTVFKGDAMTDYGRWAYKIEEAARQGAAGVLLIHDAAAIGYGWNAVQATWSGAAIRTADGGRRTPDAPPSKAGCRTDAARALFSAAGLDFARRWRRRPHAGIQSGADGAARRCDDSQRDSHVQFAECHRVACRAADGIGICPLHRALG